ncbi:MAG: hypothetical protein NXI31_03135 [bacterium]|nr:hypothetical protein [bacterium]
MTEPRAFRRKFRIVAFLVALPLLILLAFTLLAIVACTAEASEAPPLAIVVVLAAGPDASGVGAAGTATADYGIRELAQSCQERGWVTAIAGRCAAPGSDDLGFAAHCVFRSGANREWGPAIRHDGKRVTLPDDVRAEVVFSDFLVEQARRARAERPALLCYRPLAAAVERSGLEGVVRRLVTAFDEDRRFDGSVVVLGFDRDSTAPVRQGSGSMSLVAGGVDDGVVIVARRLATVAAIPTLVHEAARLHRRRSGRSLFEQLGQAELPPERRVRR